jgi:hypothetical protein
MPQEQWAASSLELDLRRGGSPQQAPIGVALQILGMDFPFGSMFSMHTTCGSLKEKTSEAV